jgi:hypothetical protein
MTKSPWFRFPLLVASLLLAAGPARAVEISPVTSLGDNTYRLTVKASNKFTRNTAKLKDQAIEEATKFCAKEGRQLQVVSAEEDKQMYLVGPMAKVTLTFKALAAGDPKLVATEAPQAKPVVVAPPPPMNADLLTSELTKLDELRKKGLLTDEEFTAAKKKLLERM